MIGPFKFVAFDIPHPVTHVGNFFGLFVKRFRSAQAFDKGMIFLNGILLTINVECNADGFFY
jgi:hypothetical protein